MNLPNLRIPARIWKTPIKTTAANKYSTPCCATRLTITTARAPVAPEIIPGRPPIKAVINPTIKAAYSPTNGWTPATNAKATASGTNAKATVSPERISVFRRATNDISVPDFRFGVLTSTLLVLLLPNKKAHGKCALQHKGALLSEYASLSQLN